MDKPKVISIIGPTAVGKTELGIEISKRFNGEVINGDSMQVYKEFNIGTAKVTEDEKDGITHHLIDILEPDETYSVSDFKKDVDNVIRNIVKNSRLPIIVGGTGFYIHATLFDFQLSNIKRNEEYVKRLENEINQSSNEHLYNRLKKLDPEYAKKTHPNNIRRVIRALEVIELTGETMTSIEKKQVHTSPYQPIIIGLTMDRHILYDRINKRVDQMIDDGLVEEVKTLYNKYGSTIQPMQGIGYKEFIPYFKGEYSFEDAINLVKRNTRRFAKRQMTYFRNKIPGIKWYTIDPNKYMESFSLIFTEIEGML